MYSVHYVLLSFCDCHSVLKVTIPQHSTQNLGQQVTLCPRCFMPLGESAYEGKQKSTFVHPECMAQAGWNFCYTDCTNHLSQEAKQTKGVMLWWPGGDTVAFHSCGVEC